MTPPCRGRELLDAATRLLSSQLASSPELRAFADALGRWLIEEAARAGGEAHETDPQPAHARHVATPAEAHAVDASAPPPTVEPRNAARLRRLERPAPAAISGPREVPPPLTLGTEIPRGTTGSAPPPSAAAGSEVELTLIAERSRLKAASCRNFIELRDARENRYHDEAAAARETECVATMRRHIDAGRAMDGCFLWVYWREQSPPGDDALQQIAACYEALADAADLTRAVLPTDPDTATGLLAAAMQFLAEAHCMLRIALAPTWLTSPDRDQDEAHLWLRVQASRRRILLPDFLRSDDIADPAGAADLRARIAEFSANLRRDRAAEAKVGQAFKKIRWHAKQILNAPDEDRADDYAKIAAAVAGLLELGIQEDDARFAEALPAEVAGAFPASLMPTAAIEKAVHSALRRSATDQDDTTDDRDTDTDTNTPEIRLARERLAGRAIVLLGGEPRNEARKRIETAFDTSVIWPALTEHGSGDSMRAPIARPDVVAVIVIIRLAGHQHTDEAREYARAADKPCISLTHGYSPAQIARALLEQAGERLGSSA